MGTWFTESSWPPIMVLATGAGASIAMFVNTQRAKYLLGILPLLILAPVIYVVEQRIVTERERVEEAVYGVTSAFEQHDVMSLVGYFSMQEPILRGLAAEAMQRAEATGDIHVTDVSVAMQNHDSRATSHFRANGPIAVAGAGDVGHRVSRWELTWQKEGGDWRIIKVERLDPISGEPMFLFAASERAIN